MDMLDVWILDTHRRTDDIKKRIRCYRRTHEPIASHSNKMLLQIVFLRFNDLCADWMAIIVWYVGSSVLGVAAKTDLSQCVLYNVLCTPYPHRAIVSVLKIALVYLYSTCATHHIHLYRYRVARPFAFVCATHFDFQRGARAYSH